MKKIININLSGRVLPMEDTAYEKLQAYIESLRRYFVNEEGRDEIIYDIESRIAELLHDKIRKGATAITDEDIEEVVSSMGRVQDFEAADKDDAEEKTKTQQQSTGSNYSYNYSKESKRLYRDSNDKMIAGVCSGIATYLGVDPAIVRILFAIISFGGFGLGFLAYIILWIVLPPRDLENLSGRRLYRNPDDKVISGVAGGLAAYFNKSATTIRLIFAAPFILNIVLGVLSWPFFHEGSIVPNFVFGSITGTFILAYIVLWIVLPEANSEYEKMEMRGEKVDVNRIRQNVREGMDTMKERMKGWGEEVKESAQNFSNKAREFSNTRGRAFGSEVGRAAGNAGRGIGHIFGVIIKAFFLFIAGSIAVGLFFGLIGLLIGGVSVWPLKNFLIDGFWQNLYGWGTLLLFLGIPLIGFIVWLLRRIMKVKSQHNYLGWTFGGLWALGWVCVTLFVASLINDFRMSNRRQAGTELTITQPVNGKMIVKVTEPEVEYSGTFPWIDIDGDGFDITKDTLRFANVKIDEIQLSDDGNYHIEVKKYSRGRTVADAETKANKIQFNINYKDSVLDLGSGIAIDKTAKFRGQQVVVVLRVPAGKKIRFDETIEKLHSFTIHVNRKWKKTRYKKWREEDWDWDNESFDYKINTDYLMDANGELKEVNASGVVITEPVKTITPEQARAADSIQRLLDDQKRKVEEETRKAKELEEKLKSSKSTGAKKIKNKIKETMASAASTVPTLMEWL
jgi:phage shock protein PspC (stress-responsive transcriptional regulator)